MLRMFHQFNQHTVRVFEGSNFHSPFYLYWLQDKLDSFFFKLGYRGSDVMMKNEFKSNVDELREMYQSIMHDEIENMVSDNFAEARKKKLKA